MLAFLIVIFLALTIATAVIVVMIDIRVSGGEISSGVKDLTDSWNEYQRMTSFQAPIYVFMDWTKFFWAWWTMWEVIALCLASWIVVEALR
jgi:hypothetical protein